MRRLPGIGERRRSVRARGVCFTNSERRGWPGRMSGHRTPVARIEHSITSSGAYRQHTCMDLSPASSRNAAVKRRAGRDSIFWSAHSHGLKWARAIHGARRPVFGLHILLHEAERTASGRVRLPGLFSAYAADGASDDCATGGEGAHSARPRKGQEYRTGASAQRTAGAGIENRCRVESVRAQTGVSHCVVTVPVACLHTA